MRPRCSDILYNDDSDIIVGVLFPQRDGPGGMGGNVCVARASSRA